MIALAETAENYVQRQHQNRASSSTNTKSGLEHRQSKQKRINEALRGDS